MPEPWRVTLFGTLRLSRGDQTITRFKYQKVGGLLAYLAFHRHQMHARETLVEMFWPGIESPEAARNSLSGALSSLRHQMEPPGTPAGAVLRADRFSVGVNSEAITTDVAEFEAAIEAAAGATSKYQRRGTSTSTRASPFELLQHLERALELHAGRLLPGFYEEWIFPEQERLAGLFFDAATDLITRLEGQGDINGALRYARKAVSVDPLREEANQHLIRLLAAAGQPGAALRQYKDLVRRLDEEMGEEPSALLRALARQIERQSLSGAVQSPVSIPKQSSEGAANQASVEPRPTLPITVTFLLTDFDNLEQQLLRLREHGSSGSNGSSDTSSSVAADDVEPQSALSTHIALLRSELTRWGGQQVREAHGTFVVTFGSAGAALRCAIAAQQALSAQEWVGQAIAGPLSVRMALHTGEVEPKEGDYQGSTLAAASRVLTSAQGGQILVSEATAALVRRSLDEEVQLVDLGMYRLNGSGTGSGSSSDSAAGQRQSQSLEHLYLVEHPGMTRVEFEPVAAPTAQQQQQHANVPLRFTRFFGRQEEIARLSEMLCMPAVRLVTLTGPGGTGKTRLSMEVAERLADSFGAGVYFVPLAAITDPSGITHAILNSLNVPVSAHREPMDQIAQALMRDGQQQRGESALLVLDNFEQLVNDGGVEVVQDLLKRVPTLTCLVTSRQILGVSAETEFPVAPLPIPRRGGKNDAAQTPEALSLFESVRLFIDRAQQVLPHFQVTSSNAPALAQLVSRLEGIPLAIELAAARAQVMTPAQMLVQLDQRFNFLVSRRRDAEERHRTLRATVDWSYRLLLPELQRYFSKLCVFRGGWTVEAAEAVCDEPLALDSLALLRECSMVRSEETETGMRFSLLDSLREYAQEQLSEEEMLLLRRRHAEYFRHLAEDFYGRRNSPEQSGSMERLEQERDNCRAALEWCLADPRLPDTGWKLARSLYWFWMRRGPVAEGLDWLRRYQPLVEKAQPIDWLFFNGIGVLAQLKGDFEQARSSFERALELQGGPERIEGGVAAMLINLASLAIDQGDWAAGEAYSRRSIEIQRALGTTGLIAGALINEGIARYQQEQLAEARESLDEALSMVMATEGGAELYSLGMVQMARGDVLLVLEEVPEARDCYRECLSVCLKTGDREIVDGAFEGMARIALRYKQQERAACLMGAADAIRGEFGRGAQTGRDETRGQFISHLRTMLAPEAFHEAWEAGRAMHWKEAVILALEEDNIPASVA